MVQTNPIWTNAAIARELIRIVQEMTADWDSGFSGDITSETLLVADLGCESIDVVQLVVAIEQCFQRRNLPFQKLLMTEDGQYVGDLSIGQVVDFLTPFLCQAAS